MNWYEDPIYIKMCEKAERVAPGLFYKSFYDSHDYTFKVDGNDLLWSLPRQDQLQAMLEHRPLKDRDPVDWFCYGVPGYLYSDDFGYGEEDDIEIAYYGQFTSMEQLWLAFVMLTLYNKRWNGEDWINDLAT